ncbi:hypothetical protein Nepgr_032489 [Nepenthes gracilis]|uniref:Uncharacterized protein n=1 Tax=Nepenthes gracilis TaxID=150966 RepID=A0AAD3Y8B9_NEPGR|nr:hypothetical protein Nepgr_032489 [Nepenthes gracilis]
MCALFTAVHGQLVDVCVSERSVALLFCSRKLRGCSVEFELKGLTDRTVPLCSIV